jgi:hypothetical protein
MKIPVVNTPSEFKAVAEALVMLKGAEKLVSDKKDEFLKPARELYATAKANYGESEDLIEESIKKGKFLLLDYLERKQKESALEAEAAFNRGDVVMALQAMNIAPNVDGVGFSTKASFEVVDQDAIPSQFFKTELDTKRILDVLKTGEEIPGIRKTSSYSVVLRGQK